MFNGTVQSSKNPEVLVRPHKPNHAKTHANTDTGNRVQTKRGRMGRQDETGIRAERNAEEECGKEAKRQKKVRMFSQTSPDFSFQL